MITTSLFQTSGHFSNKLAHGTNVSHSGVSFGETFGETVRNHLFVKLTFLPIFV